MRLSPGKIAASLMLLAALAVSLPGPVHAISDEEQETLDLYFPEQDRVVLATRNPRPLSQVAENITIVTAEEIKALNAHTLADVLNTVPGVQMELTGGPGSSDFVSIHGTRFSHVLVLIDGVRQNSFSEGFPDVGIIPVQNIERVEIVKGPASSAWGSALGGVINIITKEPLADRPVGGTLSASLGEKLTGDYRGEAGGTAGPFGYYLFAGNLTRDSLRPNTNNAVDENNLYAKLAWALPKEGRLTLSFGYSKGSRGYGDFPSFDLSQHDDYRYLQATLDLRQPLADRLDLELQLQGLRRNNDIFTTSLSGAMGLQTNIIRDTSHGGCARLGWRGDRGSLALGLDYDHGAIKGQSWALGYPDEVYTSGRMDRWGIFASGTVEIGDLTLIPGIRYDRTGTSGDFVSPSLGFTFPLTDRTLLRGTVARGFSLPVLIEGASTEKVWSAQVGVESNEIKYLWLKSTLFRDYVDDVQSFDDATGTTRLARRLRQGAEAELKTVPLWNTSLSAGFTFTDTRDRDTGEKILLPTVTWDLGLHYNDNRSLTGTLIGHYIWWNSPAYVEGKYSAFIWDLSLAKKLFSSGNQAVELFGTVHNIFNGSQYAVYVYKNPRRWGELGLRWSF